jgi:hypothetical protein|tara:strand:+ start:735 stop:959 length:225 start_codon:yes stop_codon:yes gene_type:complete
MNKTTTLTLNEDQLMRLLDGMLSTQEPLELSDSGCNKVERLLFVSNSHKAHRSLIDRLKRALNRVSADAPALTL